MANIITITEYREYDDSPSPMANESQIMVAIELATAIIEKMTGRTYEVLGSPSPSPESYEVIEILNGNGTNRIYTHNAPITAVSKVEYWNGTKWEEYDSVTYPYTFKTDSNIIYFTEGHKFYTAWQNIRVTFEYGYTDEFPDDLKLACYLITKHIVLEAERLNIKSQSDGEQSFSYDHNLPPLAKQLIARYKTTY